MPDPRLALTEYSLHLTTPLNAERTVGSSMELKITPFPGHEIEADVMAIATLLQKNGWVQNPVVSKTVLFDQHSFIHLPEKIQ